MQTNRHEDLESTFFGSFLSAFHDDVTLLEAEPVGVEPALSESYEPILHFYKLPIDADDCDYDHRDFMRMSLG